MRRAAAARIAGRLPGIYYLRLVSPGEREGACALRITVEVPADDRYEDADELTQAARLARGRRHTGLRSLGDDDWYAVAVRAGEPLRVKLCFGAEAGDLELTLHAPDGSLVASSCGTTRTERVSYPAAADGLVYLRVFGKGVGDGGEYYLELD